MKEVINLQGKKEFVPKNTTVKTVDGIHYLHTLKDDLVEEKKETEYLARKLDYELNQKYKDERKKAYGSVEEQMERLYWDRKNDTNTFVDHQDQVRLDIPKPI